MKAVEKSIGLYVREGVFYFRKGIPARHQDAFGGKKELTQSLKTTYRVDAERFARRLFTDFDQKISDSEQKRQRNGITQQASATSCKISEEEVVRLAYLSIDAFMQRFASDLWAGPKTASEL